MVAAHQVSNAGPICPARRAAVWDKCGFHGLTMLLPGSAGSRRSKLRPSKKKDGERAGAEGKTEAVAQDWPQSDERSVFAAALAPDITREQPSYDTRIQDALLSAASGSVGVRAHHVHYRLRGPKCALSDLALLCHLLAGACIYGQHSCQRWAARGHHHFCPKHEP